MPFHIDRTKLFWGVCVPAACSRQDVEDSLAVTFADVQQKCGIIFNLSVPDQCSSDIDNGPLPLAPKVTISALVFLTLLCLFATFYHLSLGHIHPKEKGGFRRKMMLKFSMVNTYRSFTRGMGDKNMNVLDGLKVVSTVQMVAAHRLSFFLISMIANPTFEESLYESGQLFSIWKSLFLDIHFVVAGFLVFWTWYSPLKNHGIKIVPFIIINRWLRLAPALLTTIVLIAVLSPYMGDGPQWNSFVPAEAEKCRLYGWKNLFGLNSFFRTESRDHICAMHMWYVAADLQLFLVGILMVYMFSKSHSLGLKFALICLAASIAIPFSVIYINKYDAVPKVDTRIHPEGFDWPAYMHINFTSYMRAGPYIMSIIAAFVLLKIRDSQWTLSVPMRWFLFIVTVIVSQGSQIYGFVFYKSDREYNAVENAAFGSIYRHLWSLLICVIVVMQLAWGLGKSMDRLLAHNLYVPISRLTYLVYLLGPIWQAVTTFSSRLPIYFGPRSIALTVISDTVVLFLGALWLYFIIEEPMNKIRSSLMGKIKKGGNRTRVLRSASLRDLESRWKDETGFFEEVLLTSPHQQPELIPRAKLRQRTLLTEIFRDAILEEEWVRRLKVKGDKMSELSSRTEQGDEVPQQNTSNQGQEESKQESTATLSSKMKTNHSDASEVLTKTPGKHSHETSEHGVITIESESIHSSDTELSTYVTCCSECDRSEDLNHAPEDNIHDKNNNKNTKRLSSIGESSSGRDDHSSENGKVYEAMNFQVKTNPKSKKIEGEEMRIKITETKENIKAITTIHLFHTPDQNGTSEVESNVSRKKRLFAPNKKSSDTKYRKLFYELPETSTETHYAEEEFVYEPRFRTTTTKLVMKARSLINLSDEDIDTDVKRSARRPGGGSRENLQRHKSEPDLDSIRTARSEAKRFDKFDDDTKFQCVKNHLESSFKKASTIRAKAEDENSCNRVPDENVNTSNNGGVKKSETDEKNKTSSASSKTTGNDETSSQRECWITGATFKNPPEVKPENFLWNTCPRRDRFCFYYPRKRNREIIDDELPDPDKVKDIRDKFEQTIQTRSTENMSQTLNHPKKPPSGNRSNKHQFNTWSPTYHTYPTVEITETSKNLKNCHTKLSDSPKFKYWSDTTSVSSGVASDFSCETDSESSPRAEVLDLFQMSNEPDNGQPVSADTLKKIRACGTTTTYYGGRMISCDKGTVRSPMTMTIMDEIRQNIKENEINLQLGIKSLQNKYSGMKFRLVKSNSCGSRLELTGTNFRDRSRKQNQPKESTKLESVDENDLGTSHTDNGRNKYSTIVNIVPDKSLYPTTTPVCISTQLENHESPQILRSGDEPFSDFSSPPEQGSKDTGDYNSICLIENGEIQAGVQAENKELSEFVRMKGQSTKDIVKVFESASSQKDGTPAAPWKTLVESRKNANRMAGVKRVPVFEEMEFEEFEVLDETAHRHDTVQNGSSITVEQNS